jgi:hypothetical protein
MDAQRRQSVGEALQRAGGGQGFVMMLLDLLLHRILDLMGIFQVHGHHPQGVANEVHGEVILADLGEAAEDRALVGIFDMALHRDHALGLHGLGQHEQKRQQIGVVGRFPVRPFEDLTESAGGRLDGGHAVGDQEGRNACAQDGHQFVRRGLDDHAHIPA